MKSDTRHGRYEGPPGDTREYWMPRDHAIWEQAWAKHLGEDAPDPIDPEAERGRGEVDMSPEAVEARRIAKARKAEAMAFIASYTGSFGLILDLRADPRWGTKHMRLSERQVEAVLASRDRDEARAIERELWQDDVYNHWLSLCRCSATGMPSATPHEPGSPGCEQGGTHARSATGEAPGLASQPTPGQAPSSRAATTPDDGWYVVDGEPWKVQWNRERTRKYAKRLVVGPDRGGPGEDRDAGHHPAAGDWVYVPGGLGIVAARGEPMTLEVAQQYGKLYGVCAICGRTLTDEKSIADGIGPVCKEKVL